MSGLTWAALEHSLGLHLARLRDGRTFILYVDLVSNPDDDPDFHSYPFYVQFVAYADEMVRCEVVGNAYLSPEHQHSVDQLVTLREIGWQLPGDVQTEVGDSGSPNHFLDVHRDDSARAAAMVVRVFREVWGVDEPHGVITDAEHLRGSDAFTIVDPASPRDARI